MRHWLPTFAFDHPVTGLMAFLALFVLGVIAWVGIPLEMMPSGFEPRRLWIWIPYENGSPAETDEEIVRPIEAQLSTIPGVERLSSEADARSAEFEIAFHGSADMDVAYNDVVDRVERAMPDLPEDLDRYFVWRFNPDDNPVLWVGIAFPDEVEDPQYVASRIVEPQLRRIPGVAAVDVWGVPTLAVLIEYDREKLFGHGVDLGDLHRRITSDNFQISGGQVREDGRNRHVRSLARIDDPSELVRYPVKDELVLNDVAFVGMGALQSTDIMRVNGLEAAALGIRKESTANTVDVTTAVRAALDRIQADPRSQGAEFFVFFDEGDLVGKSVADLSSSALYGGLLAILILLVFLREWRMTTLIALCIPFSLLITVALMYATGDSLNLVALMGLMLAVGMVVDNAIVVVETIYRRRAEGASLRAAAIEGTAEVNLAIVLSTLTTIVVFLPAILMSENEDFSFWMGVLGRPVIYALATSLFVALFFAPLATRLVRGADIKPDPRWLAWITDAYARSIRWVLARRMDVALVSIVVVILTFTVAMPGLKRQDRMEGNLNDFTIRFTVPPQATMSERDEIVRRFEHLVDENREVWGVRVHRSRLHGASSRGRVFVYLNPDGPMPRDEVMKDAKKKLPKDAPGVEATIGWGDDGNGGGNQVELSLHGRETGVLMGLADEVARRLRSVPGVLDVGVDEANYGADEVQLHLDRQALLRYGVSAQQIGRTVSYAMRGSSLNPIVQGEREIEVESRISLEDRDTLDELLDFGIWSLATERVVPLRAFAAPVMAKGPYSIDREDRVTSTVVTVDLEEDLELEDAMVGISAAMDDMVLPHGYGWSKGDRYDEVAEEDASLLFALLLSVAFVFLIMGALFESFVLPFAVITTVPLAGLGAVWALYLTGTPFDTMAGVGLVILVGIVVNNGIVLVDRVTQLRADGMPRDDALVEAGTRRLRPILMTALTTIFGLVPMALGESGIIGIPYAPLGRTVMGGMFTGTFLTLLMVPFAYTLLDDLRTRAYALWHLSVSKPETA